MGISYYFILIFVFVIMSHSVVDIYVFCLIFCVKIVNIVYDIYLCLLFFLLRLVSRGVYAH